jgi:hypothetical protein
MRCAGRCLLRCCESRSAFFLAAVFLDFFPRSKFDLITTQKKPRMNTNMKPEMVAAIRIVRLSVTFSAMLPAGFGH